MTAWPGVALVIKTGGFALLRTSNSYTQSESMSMSILVLHGLNKEEENSVFLPPRSEGLNQSEHYISWSGVGMYFVLHGITKNLGLGLVWSTSMSGDSPKKLVVTQR